MEFTQHHHFVPDYPSDRFADTTSGPRNVLSHHTHPLFPVHQEYDVPSQNRLLNHHSHPSLYQSSLQQQQSDGSNNWSSRQQTSSGLSIPFPAYSGTTPFQLTRPSLPTSHTLSHKSSFSSQNGSLSRMSLAGSLDPTTGIFYRTPEHPRLRTAQACEKCRTRKAKCSGEHPSCKRCITRGLVCEYAKEGRTRGPNKPKGKASGSDVNIVAESSPATAASGCRPGTRSRTSSGNSGKLSDNSSLTVDPTGDVPQSAYGFSYSPSSLGGDASTPNLRTYDAEAQPHHSSRLHAGELRKTSTSDPLSYMSHHRQSLSQSQDPRTEARQRQAQAQLQRNFMVMQVQAQMRAQQQHHSQQQFGFSSRPVSQPHFQIRSFDADGSNIPYSNPGGTYGQRQRGSYSSFPNPFDFVGPSAPDSDAHSSRRSYSLAGSCATGGIVGPYSSDGHIVSYGDPSQSPQGTSSSVSNYDLSISPSPISSESYTFSSRSASQSNISRDAGRSLSHDFELDPDPKPRPPQEEGSDSNGYTNTYEMPDPGRWDSGQSHIVDKPDGPHDGQGYVQPPLSPFVEGGVSAQSQSPAQGELQYSL